MGLPQINYNPGGGAVLLNCSASSGLVNFLAAGVAKVNDNVSSSGVRERVIESVPMLISFTQPALVVGNTYDDWDKFYAWALGGGTFLFVPNISVIMAAAPWSGSPYYVSCVLEDTEFQAKRAGFKRFSLDSKFRVVIDAYTPPRPGWIMSAFYGIVPS